MWFVSLFTILILLIYSLKKNALCSIVAMCTGHYPVPSGAVDMTGIEPCKKVESVSECIVNGRVRAI